MSHKPPIPEASQSPYPIMEPPHHPQAMAASPEKGPAEDDGAEKSPLVALLDDIGIDTRTAFGISAALGIGAIAGISALVISALGKRGDGKTAPAAKRKTAATTPAARRPRETKTAATKKTAAKRPAASNAAKEA